MSFPIDYSMPSCNNENRVYLLPSFDISPFSLFSRLFIYYSLPLTFKQSIHSNDLTVL